MKLAFSTLGCPDWNFNEIFATAKDLGYDGVEIRGIKNELLAPKIPEFTDGRIEATLAKLSGLGVSIPCVTSGICVRNYGLDDKADGAQVDEAVAYAKLAEKTGARYVRILGDIDVMPRGEVSDDRVEAALRDFICASKEIDAVFLLETNGAYADSMRLRKLVEKIGDEKLAILWDIHHPFRFFGEKIEDTYSNIAPFIRHVHVKDSLANQNGGAVRYKMTGKGDVPVKETVRILRENGYTGYLSLEWVKRWCADLEAPGIVFVQYINYMKKLI